jgi:hypothetical protein
VLSSRVTEDIVAVSIEAHAPETHASHELLRLFKLAVATKDGVDKLAAAVLAHGNGLLLAILLLGGLPHVVLAHLEELGEADPQTLTTLEKIFNHFVALLLADLGHRFFSPLDFAGELDEQEPELACHLGEGGSGSVVEDGPVVDPFAERVGIEDGAEEHNGFFAGVPVLVRVAGGDASAARIFFSGLARGLCGSGGRLLGGGWLRAAGTRGTSWTAGLWLIIDWDLIIVIAISIPVHGVASVLFVRRWWRLVIRVEVLVVAFVPVAILVVNDPGVDVRSRLRRLTLPLAMGALERRRV